MLIVATAPLSSSENLPGGTVNIVVGEDTATLTQRLLASVALCGTRPYHVRIELAHLNRYDGSVTSRNVQTAVIALLDAVCTALA